jgi:hypothetical protein
MVVDSADYRDIRSLAIHTEDIVTAFETNRTPGPRAVLRVLAPFAGRMRARLHLEDTGEETTRSIHIDPETLLDTEGLPAYPRATDTERALRADPEADYSIETHHERHTETVREWRETVAEAVVETIDLDGPDGPHPVDVYTLG